MYVLVITIISCIKATLIPSYKSTDFEVHRNWLAITSSLPLKEWYVNNASQWTLDYPPLFAWFEFFLSKIAIYIDPEMLNIKNLGYDSYETILFQRFSVIITDLVFAYGCWECIKEAEYLFPVKNKSNLIWLFTVLFGNAGLLLVDHVHFQYNGFLSGIFFISMARMLQGKELQSAFWFTVLLNLKHIYLYLAPAYFVYLLRSFCIKNNTKSGKISGFHIENFVKLAIVVFSVFTVSFGPFIFYGQGRQVLSRLFPFKRGITHAYWAPNFWAVYNFIDKLLASVAEFIGFNVRTGRARMTGGLIEDVGHAILPSIHPLATIILTVLSMIPCLVQLFLRPHNKWLFVKVTVMCAFCSFMFGWHVHEKAILLVLLPLTLFTLFEKKDANIFILLSLTGHYSLFPLLFSNKETITKVSIYLLHAIVTCNFLKEFWSSSRSRSKMSNFWIGRFTQIPLLNHRESLYVVGLSLIFIFSELWPLFISAYSFFPLMLTSVYCSIGVGYCWIKIYISIFHISYKRKLKTK